MENFYYEFFTNNFTAEPLGTYGWRHLTLCMVCILFCVALAAALYFLGGRGKNRKRVYTGAAIVLLSLEFFKYVVIIVTQGIDVWFYNFLPLRSNTIAIVSLPLMAWLRGNGRQSRIWRYFTLLFGLLSGAGLFVFEALFNVYPLWHFNTIIEVLTCCIPFFISVYLLFCEDYLLTVPSMKKCVVVLIAFIGIAYFADALANANYMHLEKPASTPYTVLYNIFHSSFWYTLPVALVNLAYLILSGYIIALIRNAAYRRKRR